MAYRLVLSVICSIGSGAVSAEIAQPAADAESARWECSAIGPGEAALLPAAVLGGFICLLEAGAGRYGLMRLRGQPNANIAVQGTGGQIVFKAVPDALPGDGAAVATRGSVGSTVSSRITIPAFQGSK